MDPRRSQRVIETLREELNELIEYELEDPRIGDAAVTDVVLSTDGRQARVLLTVSGTSEQQQQTLEALAHARPFLRHELGSRLSLFRLPDLRFELAIEGGAAGRLEHLLKRVRKGRPRDLEPQKSPLE